MDKPSRFQEHTFIGKEKIWKIYVNTKYRFGGMTRWHGIFYTVYTIYQPREPTKRPIRTDARVGIRITNNDYYNRSLSYLEGKRTLFIWNEENGETLSIDEITFFLRSLVLLDQK